MTVIDSALVAASTPEDRGNVGRGGITDASKATGERIRFARKWAGLNQNEVGARMGLSRASVSNWELGQGIKRENLVSFAQVVNVSTEWLMTGEPDLAPKGENRPGQASASEIDLSQFQRLLAAAFELLGKPPGQSRELAKAISKAALYLRSGAQAPHDEALTKRLAQVLVRMHEP